jgi:hypothetical protein
MKKRMATLLFIFGILLFSPYESKAQDPISLIIKEAVKKAIKQIDLQMQRLQNKTIWLQNAQKTVENKMSELKLNEIKDWVEKQRKQYDEYFQELWKVKTTISYMQKVKDIIQRQVELTHEYKTAWRLFQQDKHFSKEELQYMFSIYTGILNESIKNIDQLEMVINSFKTQMTDGQRMEMISALADKIDEQYADLKNFNAQNRLLSMQRAIENSQTNYVRKLYGLPAH